MKYIYALTCLITGFVIGVIIGHKAIELNLIMMFVIVVMIVLLLSIGYTLATTERTLLYKESEYIKVLNDNALLTIELRKHRG